MNRRDFLASAAIAASVPIEWDLSAAAAAAAAGAPPSDFPMPPPRAVMPVQPFESEPGRLTLDKGWRFHAGDLEVPLPQGHNATYEATKAGAARGAAAIKYDDSDWTTVDLPHDWVIERPFDPEANVSQGYRRRGIGWYRRTLRLEESDRGRYLELQFGAIATNATIWFNGSIVSHNWSGYNSIHVDVTDLARYGDALNTIAVRADADPMEGWWYEGGGIYRHVRLAKRPPVHITTDGIHADPRRRPDGGWTVPVVATLGNIGEAAAEAEIEAVLLDPAGKTVAGGRTRAQVMPLGRAEARIALPVPAPQLWSADTPHLYTLVTRLVGDAAAADERRLELGFRTIRFDAEHGFFLNEQPTKLKGVCIHQDHAGVGVAVPDALWEWRIRRLKALGANAIRFAHNAPPTEALDLCDRLGMLVMDENRQFNTSPDYLAQLEWMVRRDRNRPSVILWSVFNEEPMQGTPQGYEMVRRMAHVVKQLDDQRPVTAAMNNGMFAPRTVSQAVDVVGFNYQADQYDKFHAAFPDKPLTSSEDTSAFMTRGEYRTDRARHVMASYDEERADWGATHRSSWKAIAERPWLAGTFVWTGFDYHGEPTPFEWPSVSSLFGIMDLCGFPKTAFHLRRAQWVDDTPLLDLAPHWTWPGREGDPIKVMAFTNVERVALILNGRRLSEQAVDRYEMPSWSVPYAPGRLEAIGYRGGRAVVRAMVETTGAPVALRLTPDRPMMAGDGEDVQPITVDAVDAKGRHVPTANLPVDFAIAGGTIIGLGNGDPLSHEPEKGSRRSLFNGLAQVIVRADEGAGPLTLAATAPGLRTGRLSVRRVQSPARQSVAVVTDAKAGG
ncbi:glycoside hydrolase family 2 protein [Sphingomonas parva]|uniref:Glycoside hydrolase family 2 protein n=1 Tax=Sphingomonas parva TaxID=2555898 RepID=A0A4Y8ZVQ2_9SPHN|nr:beta-galactosidase GalA [Sphingomonas parva]TFI60111.1 glycoside hydrolase family 2 protein [Sphingomonas parva]